MKGGKDRRTEKGIDPFLGEITRRTDSIQQQKGLICEIGEMGMGNFFPFSEPDLGTDVNQQK